MWINLATQGQKLSELITLDMMATFLGIMVIVVSAVIGIIKIVLVVTRKMDKLSSDTVLGFSKVNDCLAQLTAEIVELRGYKDDIEQNKEDILRLQETKVDEDKFNDLHTAFTKLQTRHEAIHEK